LNAYATVRAAIEARNSISATYDGHYREMSPHAIGMKRGRRQAICYQFAGTTSSGKLGPQGSPDNWRCIAIGKLEDLRTIEGVWHTPDDQGSRPQTCLDLIDADVDR
jgi:hypothetical protein